MKRSDYKVLSIILILLFLAFLIRETTSRNIGNEVKITKGNTVIGIYPLYENTELDLGTNIVCIKDGTAYITSANCRDLLCVHQKPISHTGEIIACLPNKITVSIIGGSNTLNTSFLAFNTVINLTIYNSDDESILTELKDICDQYELICSRTNPESELYKLNHRLTSSYIKDNIIHYELSDELYEMISIGLKYSKETDDVFDIAIAPVSSLWDFQSGKSSIPDSKAVNDALKNISSNDIILYNDHTISFASDDNMIDLGALAKGYIADKLKEYLIDRGIQSATLSLGGNVLCIGSKAGAPFCVGIQKPFDNSSIATSVEVINRSVVTSGIYERYFKHDGKIYHHILDSSTGYPIINDIYGITIISDTSTEGDFLSTYLFSLGADAALDYGRSRDDIDVIVINNKGSVLYE